ncbi:MAG TPA: hypothetical protein VG425_10800 [Casimicrobiaceae bacterium]|jgi:hypothetical protein|nr:hypothetical protein [Casimicrobiaceae bacterium]
MTVRRTSTLHDLIRGGDTWRHQLQMLLASVGFSLLVGLVIALAVVGAVFYYCTEPNFRAAIAAHYEARFHAWARHDAYPIRLAVTGADGQRRELTGTPAQDIEAARGDALDGVGMLSWCPEEHPKYGLRAASRLDSMIHPTRNTPRDTPPASTQLHGIGQRDFLGWRRALERRSLQILNNRSL